LVKSTLGACNLENAVGVDKANFGVKMVAVVNTMMKSLKQLTVWQIPVVNRRYTSISIIIIIIISVLRIAIHPVA